MLMSTATSAELFLTRILLLITFCSRSILSRQFFDIEPRSVHVNPGQDAFLQCTIAGKTRESQCIWQKDGKPVGMQPGKYQWDGMPESGDCSLKIFSADIDYDDGEWICQVSASNYDQHDALSSRPAQLVVRIPPSPPRIYYNGKFLDKETALRVTAGESVMLRCESGGGNPSAELKWFVDEEELPESHQKNETEIGNPKRWIAISAIDFSVSKDKHGKSLRCVAIHDAYPKKSIETSTSLDIFFTPTVRLERNEMDHQAEADVDSVKIRCKAEGNPAPTVLWRKAGGESIFRTGENLFFEPVKAGDGGTYYCKAKNEVGSSDELSVTFDVLYPPRNVMISPDKFTELKVGSRFQMKCQAAGNPHPSFEWLQKAPMKQSVSPLRSGEVDAFSRGSGSHLEVSNVSYTHEGQWACVASNTIKGREQRVQSASLHVEVNGQPQVIRSEAQHVMRGSEAVLEATFCSDPAFTSVSWEWGSLRLEEGQNQGRFSMAKVVPDERKDCHSSRLFISDVMPSDQRSYFLNVTNELGRTRIAIDLTVTNAINLGVVIGSIFALVAILALGSFCFFTYKKRKLFFRNRHVCNKKSSLPTITASSSTSSVSTSTTMRNLHSIGIPHPAYSLPGPIPVPALATSTPIASPQRATDISLRRRNWVAAYPLPPQSSFHLNGPNSRQKRTPQNHVEAAGSHPGLSSQNADSCEMLSPTMMYAELAFPPPKRSNQKVKIYPIPSSSPHRPSTSTFSHQGLHHITRGYTDYPTEIVDV